MRLLFSERVDDEMLLQLLVGVVDAQLLERVGLEDFEACTSSHTRARLLNTYGSAIQTLLSSAIKYI